MLEFPDDKEKQILELKNSFWSKNTFEKIRLLNRLLFEIYQQNY